MSNINARNNDGSIDEKVLMDFFKSFFTKNFLKINPNIDPRLTKQRIFHEFNTLYPAPEDTIRISISKISKETKDFITALCENKCALRRLGSRITKLRNIQNLSISELARRAGMSAAFVSKLESGKSTIPKREGITTLAKALNVAPNELLSLVDNSLVKQELKDIPWNKTVENILYDLGITGTDKDDVLNFIEYKRWATKQKQSLH